MSYLSRVKKAKQLLADIRKPDTSFQLKYAGMNAEDAWDQFFHLFVIKFRNATKVTAETTPLQWKILSDIYNFLDDKVIRLSTAVSDFKWLMEKFGTDEYYKAFRKHYTEIEVCVTELKSGAHECKQKALRYQLAQHSLYLKYEPYLSELLKLTPERLFDDYFLKGQIPLETFDEICVDAEGDPIKNLSKVDK